MTHRKTLFTKASILAIAATIALPSITITLPACSQSFPRERVRERRQRNLSQPVSEPVASIPSNLYKANPGPYQVGVADNLTLTDTRNNRQLPIKVYYPQGLRGPAPVIIFSHGGGGSKDGFTYLSEYWASQGYISIHPTHDDPTRLRDNLEDATPLIYRSQDISFIIDSLPTLENQIPQIRGKMDRSRIGVAGHSFGAYTTMLMAGALVDTAQRPDASFRDNRVRAFLAISPSGAGRGGLDENSWSRITSPMMVVTGTNEAGDTWRIEPFNGMPPGDKYFLLFEGAYHNSYNDFKPVRRGREQDPQRIEYIHTYLQSASVAFWDTYLNQDNTARQFLQSNIIPSNNQAVLPGNSSRRSLSTNLSSQVVMMRK